MDEQVLELQEQNSQPKNKIPPVVKKVLNALKKAVQFVLAYWFFIFYPVKIFKELVYDKMRHEKQKVFISWMFLAPTIIGFLLFFAYPLVMSLIYSFSSIEPNGTYHFATIFYEKSSLITDPINVKPLEGLTFLERVFYNYKYSLRVDPNFLVSLWDTCVSTVVDTAVITIFSLLVAVMLNGKFRGRTFVRAVFFLPVVFNSEAITAALEASEGVESMLNAAGGGALTQLFDLEAFMTGLGLGPGIVGFLSNITATIYDTISYSGIQILIFLTAIQSVPKHLYEAATMEGATAYEQFWKITLPMVSPMILTVVVYTIVDSFLRSDICSIMDDIYLKGEYGYYAAMSWLYIVASAILMMVILGILSKVVFYYDEKK